LYFVEEKESARHCE